MGLDYEFAYRGEVSLTNPEYPLPKMDEAYACLLNYDDPYFNQEDYDTTYQLYKAYIIEQAGKLHLNGKPTFQSGTLGHIEDLFTNMLDHYGLPQEAEQVDFFTKLFGFDELGNPYWYPIKAKNRFLIV